jgi:hypothetical protein
MNSDAALDDLAFHVGLRLIGPDARRRLRIALARHPELDGPPGFDVDAVEHIDALVEGRRQPATLQDRLSMARAEAERAEPRFDEFFWDRRAAELVRGGWGQSAARKVIAEVRARVELLGVHGLEEELPCSE